MSNGTFFPNGFELEPVVDFDAFREMCALDGAFDAGHMTVSEYFHKRIALRARAFGYPVPTIHNEAREAVKA